MEHITVSELTADAAPVIPYVGSKAWDGLPFLSYMEREGWNEAQLISQDDGHKRSEREILDFLQTWLFFGLIAESCGSKGHRAYFVRSLREGEHVICTTNLRAIFRQEKKGRSQNSKEDFERWQHRITECLEEAHSMLAKLAIAKAPYLSSPVMFGIAALCDFVKKTALTEQARLQCSLLSSGASQFIQDAMIAQGWCRTDAQRLSSGLDIASLYLVASQPRPNPEKIHSDCVNRKCGAYQVDEKHYVRRHDSSCERKYCRDLLIESTSFHAVLLSGSIPLTRFKENSVGDFEVQIVKAEPGTKYVAISHVWSDGFGNPKDNGLFTCQARRIARYVSSLMGSTVTDIPFWIDTLSCPVTPPEATDLAISMMRETYANAEKVLVLNSHLVNRKKPALCLEVLALVISSSWTRRLSTLQEGVLAKQLVFQFQDESVDLGTAIALAQLELQQFLEPESLEYAALLNMATQLHDLWEGKAQSVSERLLKCLHSELQWRSTSVPTDEPLCISALLGFPLQDIMSVDVRDRTSQLWKLIRQPPKLVLFWSGDRLESPGFRWAPATFLETSVSHFEEAKLPTAATSTQLDIPEPVAHLTEDGLILRSDGLKLGDWTANIPSGFFLNPGNGSLLWLTRQRNSHAVTPTKILMPPESDNKTNRQSKQLSLLLQRPVEHLLFPTKQGAVSALLLSHYDQEGVGIIKAAIEDVCTIFPAYFLTEGQKRTVDETWEQCMEALAKAETQATAATVSITEESTGDRKQPESLHEHIRSDGEHFYVARAADGLIRIEYDGAYWWIECGKISLDQEWCLF